MRWSQTGALMYESYWRMKSDKLRVFFRLFEPKTMVNSQYLGAAPLSGGSGSSLNDPRRSRGRPENLCSFVYGKAGTPMIKTQTNKDHDLIQRQKQRNTISEICQDVPLYAQAGHRLPLLYPENHRLKHSRRGALYRRVLQFTRLRSPTKDRLHRYGSECVPSSQMHSAE